MSARRAAGYLVLPCLILFQADARAQLPRGGAAPPQRAAAPAEVLRIRNFSGLGGNNLVRTPEYDTNVARGVKRPQEWFRLAVAFDTAPEWMDGLTAQYFVLTGKREAGNLAYSLFATTARYSDVEEGRSHMVAAYLHPKALLRYGEVAAVAVVFRYQGAVVGTESEEAIRLPEQWWAHPRVVESEEVTRREDYLMDRSESPFALINIDDYEFVK